MHGGAPLRAKSVEGYSIPHLVQRCREVGRRGQLVVVDDATRAARLAGRTGDVEEDEHGEVPPTPLALYVDGVIGERAGPDLDVGLDCGVEIEILTLRLATVSLELRSEAGQSTSQGSRVSEWYSGPFPLLGLELKHRAPLRSIPAVMDIPLRIDGSSNGAKRAVLG